MKKLVFLFLSLLTAGSLFQACDNSKTYAEMLEDEKNAVNKFIKDNDIRVISQEEFERDTVTASKEAGDGYDEYVAFSNGVYMQIVDRGGKDEDKSEFENAVDTFANNNELTGVTFSVKTPIVRLDIIIRFFHHGSYRNRI